MGFLPSKNFIAPVLAALVVIFVGWFVMYVIPSYQSPIVLKQGEGQQISFLAAYQDANRDSDNDGLKDWEEILWKTDPLNPDTDGDGTPDGEEVKEGRDPTVPGHKLPDGTWSDSLSKLEKERKTATTTPMTATDRISRQFAAEYLSALGSGNGTLSDFQKQSVAESLLKSVAGATMATSDKFSSADIQIAASPPKDFIKAYLNKTGEILTDNLSALSDSELAILDRALSSENFQELGGLTNYINAYQKTLGALKKEKVPDSYAPLHVELMNILNNIQIADLYMQSVEKDPAKGLSGLAIYLKQIERGQNFSKSMKEQIKIDGINFSSGEAGYHFANYGL